MRTERRIALSLDRLSLKRAIPTPPPAPLVIVRAQITQDTENFLADGREIVVLPPSKRRRV